MTLLVEKAAIFMSIQDLGRFGFRRYGMPESGPIDWWAFRAANKLVNNAPMEACLEIGFTNALLHVETDCLLAVCGAGYQIYHNGRQLPLWMAFATRKGDRIFLEKCSGGNWIYLAVSGGILSQSWMGSRSVYPKAGLGRFLTDGDRMTAGTAPRELIWMAGQAVLDGDRPAYGQDVVVGVMQGPQYQFFTSESQRAFWTRSFSVTSRSDRMGYRLAGPELSCVGETEMVSQGMVLGEIQVPPDGQPIVMMPEHPTTGGYPSIGVIAQVDLPLLAQAQPGITSVQFKPMSLQESQGKFAEAISKINKLENEQEEPWMNL
jgi:antagonist of KipI